VAVSFCDYGSIPNTTQPGCELLRRRRAEAAIKRSSPSQLKPGKSENEHLKQLVEKHAATASLADANQHGLNRLAIGFKLHR